MVIAMMRPLLCVALFSPAIALADGPAAMETPPENAAADTAVHQQSEAETADPWNLALGLGFGQQYAGLGANLAAYVRVDGMFSVGAFGSVGLVDLDTCCGDWAWSAGALAAWGWTDRLALAASFGAVWNESVSGDVVNGVTVAIGYEKLTRAGFWFRWLAGVAFPTEEMPVDKAAIPSINVGLGWKI